MSEQWIPVSVPVPGDTLVWVWDPDTGRAVLARAYLDPPRWMGPPTNPRVINATHWQHLTVPGAPSDEHGQR